MSNHELAGELAREIDVVLGSHEAVLAPVIMDAYLAGGRQRAELFQPGETGVASFGGGGFLAVLPNVLIAIQSLAGQIYNLLDAQWLSTLVTLLNTAVAAADLRRAGKEAPPMEIEKRSDLIVNEDILKSLEVVKNELDAALRSTRLERREREEICMRVLLVLLRKPDASRGFLISTR